MKLRHASLLVRVFLGLLGMVAPGAHASPSLGWEHWSAPRSEWEPRLPPANPCGAVVKGVDILLDALRSESRPSARLIPAFDGTFGYLAEKCSVDPGKYAQWYGLLIGLEGSLAQRLRAPGYLARRLPASLREPRLDMARVLLWALPVLERESRSQCRTGCPAASWMEALASEAAPPSPDPELLARAEALLVSPHTKFLAPALLRFLAASSSPRLDAMLAAPLTLHVLRILGPHADTVVARLPHKLRGSCASEASLWKRSVSEETRPARPELLAWTARRMMALCGAGKSLGELRSALAGRIAIRSAFEKMASPSLDDAVASAYPEDVSLRRALGLGFLTSPAENLLEIQRGNLEGSTLARDSVMVAHLRSQQGSSPWLMLDGVIELVEERRALEREILGRLRTSGQRFLALSFLLTHGEGDTSQHTVNAIRQLSTELASVWEPMRDVAWQVHNNLEPSLVERIRGLAGRPEASPHQEKLGTLVTLLERFFGNQGNLRERLASLERWRPQDSVAFASALAEPNAARRLVNAVDVGERLVALADDGSQPLELHSEVLGALLALQGEVQRLVGIVKPGDLSAPERSALVRFVVRLCGFEPASLDSQAIVRLTQEIQALFRERIELMQWFLFIQHSRAGASSEYVQTVEARREALVGLTEKLIRDLGVHLLVPFAEPLTDVSELHWRSMNPGVAVGQLVFVPRENLERHAYRSDEILVTDGIPLNLGVTAGVVTEVFQPLASHVDLRTRERGTPNAFFAGAHEKWKELLGHRVKLVVSDEGVTVERFDGPLPRDGAARHRHEVPPFRSEVVNPLDLDSPGLDISSVGAKAWGYAGLRSLFAGTPTTPKALAIPFGAYLQVARDPAVAPLVTELLKLRKRLPPAEVEARLDAIRKAIRGVAENERFASSAWSQGLVESLVQLADATGREGMAVGWNMAQRCFRFRSSTNAEDLVAFTGAGLYDSATGCLAPEGERKKQTPARALGKVWASLWTYRAFMEREHLGIDHRKVAMSVLVHRHWDDETANGVLITSSGLDERSLVSVQRGEDLVTNPTGGPAGDEILVRRDGAGILSARYSDASQPILSDEELSRLLVAGEKVRRHFASSFAGQADALALRFDIEFKFVPWADGGRQLIVKQARPYLGRL